MSNTATDTETTRDLDTIAAELTGYQIDIAQRDGPARTVVLDALDPALGGDELTVTTDGDERRLSPEKAHWLADVTEAMVRQDGVGHDGATEFIAHLREWARAAGAGVGDDTRHGGDPR